MHVDSHLLVLSSYVANGNVHWFSILSSPPTKRPVLQQMCYCLMINKNSLAAGKTARPQPSKVESILIANNNNNNASDIKLIVANCMQCIIYQQQQVIDIRLHLNSCIPR